jgi:Bacterial dnaA protein helix-turn-helix
MGRQERSRQPTIAAPASGVELMARYHAARARLMGPSPPPRLAQPTAPAAVAPVAPPVMRRPVCGPMCWLPQLIAFNEELRTLFVRAAAYPAIISGEQIRAVVAQHYDLTLAEMSGGRGVRRVSWPRQIAMYICARHAALSSPSIGRLFGNRDHSTVLYALRTVATRLDQDPGLKRDIDTLIEKCRRGALE